MDLKFLLADLHPDTFKFHMNILYCLCDFLDIPFIQLNILLDFDKKIHIKNPRIKYRNNYYNQYCNIIIYYKFMWLINITIIKI